MIVQMLKAKLVVKQGQKVMGLLRCTSTVVEIARLHSKVYFFPSIWVFLSFLYVLFYSIKIRQGLI